MSVSLIKIGGSLAVDEAKLADFAEAMADLVSKGEQLILVHGGGKDINANLALLQEEVRFENGLRVTDEPVMKMVEMTLSAHVNKKLVRLLLAHNCPAAGISGVDGATFVAEKKQGEIDLGFVGTIKKVNTKLVESLLGGGFLPVVSPVSTCAEHQTWNINADEAASALANALKVTRLVFVSDVPGVLQDDQVISELDESKITQLVDEGVIAGGMIPKTRSCLESLAAGISEVHIVGWAGREAFEAQITGEKNSGTIIR